MSTEVRRNDAESRYEIVVDGTVAGYTTYEGDGGVLTFPHTVVEDAYSGQGLASRLVRETLDDVRERGQTVVPVCPYVQGWIEKHPDYADLVAS